MMKTRKLPGGRLTGLSTLNEEQSAPDPKGRLIILALGSCGPAVSHGRTPRTETVNRELDAKPFTHGGGQ